MTLLNSAFINLPGGSEWLWILLIVIVLFGASRLPALFRAIGRARREFKEASEGVEDTPQAPARGKADQEKEKAKADSKPPVDPDG